MKRESELAKYLKGNWIAEKCYPHIGHNVVCVCYHDASGHISDICIECEDCYEVLISAESESEADEEEEN